MIKYKVVLTAEEKHELEQITSQGKHPARNAGGTCWTIVDV